MNDFRLPQHVRPTSYELTLKPNLETGRFSGRILINIDVEQHTREIRMHAKGLNVNAVRLMNGRALQYCITNHLEMLMIHGNFEEDDEVQLCIDFDGNMKNRIVGLYRSSYTNEKGEKRSIATSKFEPTYARQAYPCFDEPNMKANFTVHLLRPFDESYIALSNMPENYETVEEDGVMVHFKQSVRMSTYLSCFIVSDFKATNDVISSSHGDIPFRVFATPAQLEKTNYARDVGKKVMEYYLDYFGIAYPLPKLDMVAIPDFVSGAMEHWGLITYRETALLFDPNISTTSNKMRVAQVVAHELAHSWFGNLVTMDWWDDLWLNEGFASYIEYKGVNAAEPNWNYFDLFLIRLQNVMRFDATTNTHPIVQTVQTPDQITEIFDTISYSKGASILRMLEHSIGEKVFQTGVTNYLREYAFQNARTSDFLREMQKLVPADVNVVDYIGTWTKQAGLPIVYVVKMNNSYLLTQKRFYIDADNDTKLLSMMNEIEYDRWTIPITYITKEDREPKLVWFKQSQHFININVQSDWVKFNHHQVGFYRTQYERDVWLTLVENLAEFDMIDRTHLLEESFELADAGELDYDVALQLAERMLEKELEYLPLTVATNAFAKLSGLMQNSHLYTDFKLRMGKFAQFAYDNLTWNESDDDSDMRKQTRVKVLSFTCDMDNSECLQEAEKQFKLWLYDDGAKISPNLKPLIFNYGMIEANTTEWETVWERFVNETDAGEKIRLMSGLCSVKNPTLLLKLIDLAKDETYIRNQDYFTLLTYIADNIIGTNLVWDYVRGHWLDLVARFGLNERYLGRAIYDITVSFASNVKLDEMKAFFAKYPEAGAGTAARKQALEKVANNIKWLERNRASIESWLTN